MLTSLTVTVRQHISHKVSLTQYLSLLGLEINFERCDHSIEEGGTLRTDIRLQHGNNQNPFTVTLSPLSLNTTETLGLGFFINSDDIDIIYRATAGIYTYHVAVSLSFNSLGAIYILYIIMHK